jgi:outer membrane protein assembly factor BamD (BamD/ComL family)
MFQDAQGLGPATDRLAAYHDLVATYPDSSVSVQAQFMIGFINSEELKSYDEAEKALRELLARYPDSELAESARWMLENMRTKDAPDFVDTPDDSTAAGSGSSEGSGSP